MPADVPGPPDPPAPGGEVPPSPSPHRLWTTGFVLMWAGQFLISMNFYLLMTVMALYAMERFGTDGALAGVATSAFIVGAVLARLLTGKYMELLGRRRVLCAALVLLVLCAAAYVLDTGFRGLLVVRVLNGVGFGMVTTALPAAVQALIPAHRRGVGTGYFMLSTTLAAALGPLAGLSLSTAVGYDTLFVVCTATALLGLAVGAVTRVPELSLSPSSAWDCGPSPWGSSWRSGPCPCRRSCSSWASGTRRSCPSSTRSPCRRTSWAPRARTSWPTPSPSW
jgi:MFS family permease